MSEKKDVTPYFDSMMELKKSQDEIIKSLTGIYMIFKVLSPKVGPFLSKNEKMAIDDHLIHLGKTIIKLSED